MLKSQEKCTDMNEHQIQFSRIRNKYQNSEAILEGSYEKYKTVPTDYRFAGCPWDFGF